MRYIFAIAVLFGLSTALQAASQYPITVLYKKDTATSADRLDPAVQSALQALDEQLLDANFQVIQPEAKVYEQLDRAQGVVVTFSPAAGYSLLLDVVKSKRPYSGTNMTYAEVRIRTRVYHGRNVLASYAELGTVAYKDAGAEDKAFEAAARRAAEKVVPKIADRLASTPPPVQPDETASLVVDSSISAPSPSQVVVPAGKKWALMIGVSDFSQVRKKLGPGVSDLPGVKVDMETMRKAFKDLGVENERLIWLFNEKATTKNILSTLQRIKEASSTDDLVYVYLSTHGLPKHEGLSGFGIPVTYDMNMDNFIDFESFRKSIAELGSNNVIWINDTCHSGMAAQGMTTVEVGARSVSIAPQGSFRAAVAAGIRDKNIAVISSATEAQVAGDLGPEGGLFTSIIAAGIRQMLSAKDVGPLSAYGFFKNHIDGKVQAKFKDVCLKDPKIEFCHQGVQQPVFAAQKDGKLLKM